MEYYAGIDVSLEHSSVCVVEAGGKIVREAKVASDPEALSAFLRELGLPLTRLGLEAGPLSQWLHAGLAAAGFTVVLLETRHVKAALSAMTVKTDRKDARGIAQLLRLGWYRPVHCKSPPSQAVRALLTGRKLLLGKVIDIELGMRGLLRGFGLKMGTVSTGRFAARVRELAAGPPMLEPVAEAMLRAREVLRAEVATLHRQVLATGRCWPPAGAGDRACRRGLSAADDRAGRRRPDRADLQGGGGRSRPFLVLQGGGRPFRPDAEEIPVRRDRHHRRHQQDRRCHGAQRPL